MSVKKTAKKAAKKTVKKAVKKTAPKAAKKAVRSAKTVSRKETGVTVELASVRKFSEKELLLAEGCLKCPICKKARASQKGFFFWLVNKIEGKCPQCRAYERVYGKKAHEKI
jgi:ubiquitin C-terminal hydrolase